MRAVVFAGGKGSEQENWGRARFKNQFLYDSKDFSCSILYTSMHTRPVTWKKREVKIKRWRRIFGTQTHKINTSTPYQVDLVTDKTTHNAS